MIDTDIASYLIKARFPLVDARFAESDPAMTCISAVTKSELMFGLKTLEHSHRLHLSVRQFFHHIDILSWGDDAAEVHAELRHKLISTGRKIGEMDMMIAAHAITLGAVLVTNNTKHFDRLAPELTIENWVAEPAE